MPGSQQLLQNCSGTDSLKPRKVLLEITCFGFSNLRIFQVLARHKNRFLVFRRFRTNIEKDETSLCLSVMFLTENSLSLPSETSKMENSWDNEKRIELSETIHVI